MNQELTSQRVNKTKESIEQLLALALRETWTISSPTTISSFFDPSMNTDQAIQSGIVKLLAQIEESCINDFNEIIIPKYQLKEKLRIIEQASIEYYQQLHHKDKESIFDYAKKLMLEKQEKQIAFLEAMLAQKKSKNQQLLNELADHYQVADQLLYVMKGLLQETDLIQAQLASGDHKLLISGNNHVASTNFKLPNSESFH